MQSDTRYFGILTRAGKPDVCPKLWRISNGFLLAKKVISKD